MKPVVYIDILFLINFCIDFVLLVTTRAVTNNPARGWRLAAGAFLGGVYACLMFFPVLGLLYGFLFRLLFSAVLVCVSFSLHSVREFGRVLFIFYAVSFVFAGSSFALFFCTDIGSRIGAMAGNGILYFQVPLPLLAVSTGFSYVLIRLVHRALTKKLARRRCLYTVCISRGTESVKLQALLDTGNTLTDPFSHDPVIIVQYNSIKRLLSQQQRRQLHALTHHGAPKGAGSSDAAGSSHIHTSRSNAHCSGRVPALHRCHSAAQPQQCYDLSAAIQHAGSQSHTAADTDLPDCQTRVSSASRSAYCCHEPSEPALDQSCDPAAMQLPSFNPCTVADAGRPSRQGCAASAGCSCFSLHHDTTDANDSTSYANRIHTEKGNSPAAPASGDNTTFFRPIFYHGLGTSDGMLLAFRPDCITVDGEQKAARALVAIYKGHLTHTGEYTALLHPALLTDKAN